MAPGHHRREEEAEAADRGDAAEKHIEVFRTFLNHHCVASVCICWQKDRQAGSDNQEQKKNNKDLNAEHCAARPDSAEYPSSSTDEGGLR